MGIDDMKDKATDAMNSDRAEDATDTGLDKAGDAASKASGGRFDEKSDSVKASADEHVGNE